MAQHMESWHTSGLRYLLGQHPDSKSITCLSYFFLFCLVRVLKFVFTYRCNVSYFATRKTFFGTVCFCFFEPTCGCKVARFLTNKTLWSAVSGFVCGEVISYGFLSCCLGFFLLLVLRWCNIAFVRCK